MKRIITAFMIPLILLTALTGCGSEEQTDYESPEEVVDATIEAHPITDGEIYDIYDDLEGKTFKVKTNCYKENDICLVYDKSYKSNTVEVFLGEIYDENGNNIKDFDYKEGDTLVLEIDFVSFRGTKNGKIRQYFINAVLPDR